MIKSVKKVITKDLEGQENGFRIELQKDGKYTSSYLSCCMPGSFKGWHLHKVREANYVCIRGTIKIILYLPEGRQEFVLTSDLPQSLHIPVNVPTGLKNEGTEEAWIINFPQPFYDPDLKDEQVDYTDEQVEALFKKLSQ
jgi:dTDP-4-dehydrorhamnose 3,5-epimerase-like enzyme